MNRDVKAAFFVAIVVGGVLGFGLSYAMFHGHYTNLQVLIQENADVFDQQITGLDSELSSLNMTLLGVETDVTDLDDYILKVENDTAAQIDSLDSDFDLQITELDTEVSTLNTTLQDVSTDVTDLDDHISRVEDEVTARMDSLDDSYHKLSGKLLSLKRRFNDLEERFESRNFQTLDELTGFLEDDTTDQQTYIPDTHDCDDFAFELMISAFRSGYNMGTVSAYYTDDLYYIEFGEDIYWLVPIAYSEWPYNLFGNHMINIAYVDTMGWVLIEPQNDSIYPLYVTEL